MCHYRQNETNSSVHRRKRHRAGGIRTRGLLHPRQALYQAEPQPELIAAPEIKTRREHLFRVLRPWWQGRIREQFRAATRTRIPFRRNRLDRSFSELSARGRLIFCSACFKGRRTSGPMWAKLTSRTRYLTSAHWKSIGKKRTAVYHAHRRRACRSNPHCCALLRRSARFSSLAGTALDMVWSWRRPGVGTSSFQCPAQHSHTYVCFG